MKISKLFLRRSTATLIGMLALQCASSHAALCEYVIQNEWGSGFVANIRITNDTSTAINGWSVKWNYTDGTTRTGGWSAIFSGSGPYTATGSGWNSRIDPGQTIEIGVQGNKGIADIPAQRPTVTGEICSVSVSTPASNSAAVPALLRSNDETFASSPDANSIVASALSSALSLASDDVINIAADEVVDAHPLDNPFVGARWYVDPVWSAKARGEAGGDKVARFNTAVWMDRIGAIAPDEGFGLRDHLDAALEQGANLIQVVVYDLPNRDCHALASNGELTQGPEGTARYRTEYVDVLADIFADSKYSNLRIVAIIEPDSLPNLVTNLSDADCQLATDATHGYVANTRYTLNKLSQIPNVYNYVDIGHSGWLGWDDNFGEAATLIGDAIKGTTKGVRSIAGFVSNTAGYTPTHEPFLDSLANSAFPGSGGGTQVRQASFYEWNPYFSEVAFVQAWRTRMIGSGFPSDIGMLIDTSRNGWGGSARPTAQSTSTQLDAFVDGSRVDRRIHRGNWCNQSGGIGERPQAAPASGVDAYVWVKPPGESDGASSLELSYDPIDPAKGFDRMCDPTYSRSEGDRANVATGAQAEAPVAGRWFPGAFQVLVQNAYPALEDVPASSSAASSSAPASSSSVVSSSVASSVVVISSAPSSSSEANSSSEASSSSEVSSVVSSSESSASSSTSGNQPPVANLTVTANGPTIHVDGRTSTDPEGDSLTYVISFGDDSDIWYPEAWHTYAASGSYTVTLTVSDGTNSTTVVETVEVEAAAGNRAPIAKLSVSRNNLYIVAFGSTSFDPDGDPLTYLWNFGAEDIPGSNVQVFPDCESETSIAVPRLVTLTVFDGELADTRQVRFDQPCGIFEEKTAQAEFSWRAEGNTVYVDGRATSDAVYLAWDFGDGSASASGLVSSHTYSEPGNYTITLTAYGPDLPGTKMIDVTVGGTSSVSSSSSSSVASSVVSSSESSASSSTSGNQPPVANLTVTTNGPTIHVNGRTSSDPEGDSLTYVIDFGDDSNIWYPEAWHTYDVSGSYTVTLTVSDGTNSTTAVETIEVQAATGNRAPLAKLSVARNNLYIVGFGSASFDPEGEPLTYLWDFGTEEIPGSNVQVFPDCESETSIAVPRLVTLTVFDGELADTQQVRFDQPCGIYEEKTIEANFSWRAEGNTVHVDGRATNDAVYLAWDFGDGSASASGLISSHTYSEPGNYTITLTAYGQDLPGTKVIDVTVGGGASSDSSSSSSSVASSVVSSSESSASSSISGNQAPVANLTVTATGSTIHVNGRTSSDPEGDSLSYVISFGDDSNIWYPEAWHTYAASGSYTVTLTVSDGTNSTTVVETIEVQAAAGNRAPIAKLSVTRNNLSLVGFASASFDPDADPLTYLWDFGGEEVPGDNVQVFNDCESETSIAIPRLVTLTVFDGELADTRQVRFDQPCGVYEQKITQADFSWRAEGNTVYVDGRETVDPVYLAWDFGDGSASTSGLLSSHTYSEPGNYTITLTAYGPYLPATKEIEVTVGGGASSESSSSAGVSSSSSSESSSPVTSSSSSSSSSIAAEPNSYIAPRAQTAPAIDGTVDDVWEQAAWAPIDVFWLGTQANPDAADYSGRYKALWDENYLYLLFDITDERIYDGTRDPLSNYWEDDTVEIFIDENKNGGQHEYNTSAWAYHISTYGDVVDYTTSGPKLLNDHIDVRLVSMGDKHVWEMRVRIYGEDYSDSSANTPLTLTVGKELGFSASYIDNDGSPQRESMMGSVDTAGHKNNQGYINASSFGSLKLVE
jgi:cellulase/cellobiase CelA1